MLTNSWRRNPGLALAVLTLIVSLPDLAKAQQSGLFPLHPIRRERVPCNQEDPVYKLYRYQYFGYHPTVWRRFPDGWGVPSPEAPDAKREFEKLPLAPPQLGPLDMGEEEAPGAALPGRPEGGRQPLPTPPGETERSPFELDKPAPPPGAGAAPGAPGRGQPAPRDTRSPFETLEPKGEAAPGLTPPSPRGGQEPRAGASTPSPRANGPDLAPPEEADSLPGAPRATFRDEDVDRDSDRGPLLALPDASLPPADEQSADLPRFSEPPDQNVAGTSAGDGSAPVAQPAPKRGRLVTFFSGLGWNWRRR